MNLEEMLIVMFFALESGDTALYIRLRHTAIQLLTAKQLQELEERTDAQLQ